MRQLVRAVSMRPWLFLSCALLPGVAVVAAATVGHYGITWDEMYYKEYGVVLINWYRSLGADQEALTKWGLFYYGGFFDIVAELVTMASPHGIYETRHGVSLAFGLLGIAATYGIGYQLAGIRGGFLSALFITLTPAYYGQMFTNAKDIPFAALFALSLFCMLRSVGALPRLPKSLLLQLGIAIGLAMAVRVAGMVLLVYLALLWFGWFLSRYWTGSMADRRDLLRVGGRLLLRFSAVTLLAWLTMVAFWPWAQVSPILHPLQALRQTVKYDWPLTVLFDGSFVNASALPPHYLPTWLAISLPEFHLAALLIGCALSLLFLHRLVRGRAEIDPLLKFGLLVAAASVPILSHILLRPTIYDGLRQFLFILPALAALAGASTAALLSLRIRLSARLAAIGVMVVSMGFTLFDMVELHPYQYVYFNRLIAGGLESAGSRFETDYYGASYREGLRWLAENYHPNTREQVRVANPSIDFLTGYYLETRPELRKRFKHVKPWDKPHIYMSITRWDWHKSKKGKLLHVVHRKNVPLLYVIELTPPEPADRPAGTEAPYHPRGSQGF